MDILRNLPVQQPASWPGCAKRSSGESLVITSLVATAMAAHKKR